MRDFASTVPRIINSYRGFETNMKDPIPFQQLPYVFRNLEKHSAITKAKRD